MPSRKFWRVYDVIANWVAIIAVAFGLAVIVTLMLKVLGVI